jgi:hypothetical protein
LIIRAVTVVMSLKGSLRLYRFSHVDQVTTNTGVPDLW